MQQNLQEVMDKVRKAAETKAAAEAPAKNTLRYAIMEALARRMTFNGPGHRGRDRGKGRPNNGGHPSLLNLHRDMGHKEVLDTKSDRWIDANAEVREEDK